MLRHAKDLAVLNGIYSEICSAVYFYSLLLKY